MLKACLFCHDSHSADTPCPAMLKAKIKTPYELAWEADTWLTQKLGTHVEYEIMIEIIAEYLKRGGRRPVLAAGMRVVVYDRKADRERQRLARIRRKLNDGT